MMFGFLVKSAMPVYLHTTEIPHARADLPLDMWYVCHLDTS